MNVYMGGVLNDKNCPSPRGTNGWSNMIVVGVFSRGGGSNPGWVRKKIGSNG